MNCRCRHGWISTILCRMGEERHENILQGLSRWSGGENCEVPMQGVPVWSLVRELRSTCHEAQPKKIKNKNGEGDNTLQWHNVLRSHFQLCRVTAAAAHGPGSTLSSGKHCAPQRPGCRGRLTAGACTGVIYQDYQPRCALRNYDPRTSLAAQCLRLPAHNTGDTGSIPDWGTEIPHAIRRGIKKTMTPDSGRRDMTHMVTAFQGNVFSRSFKFFHLEIKWFELDNLYIFIRTITPQAFKTQNLPRGS